MPFYTSPPSSPSSPRPLSLSPSSRVEGDLPNKGTTPKRSPVVAGNDKPALFIPRSLRLAPSLLPHPREIKHVPPKAGRDLPNTVQELGDPPVAAGDDEPALSPPYSRYSYTRYPSRLHRLSRSASFRSSRTISLTSSSKETSGSQPNLSRALVASPSRVCTSAGR